MNRQDLLFLSLLNHLRENSTIDIQRISTLYNTCKKITEDDIFNVSKFQLNSLLSEHENEKSINNFDAKDIALISVGIVPKRYIVELSLNNLTEQELNEIIDIVFLNNVFNYNAKTIRDQIIDEIIMRYSEIEKDKLYLEHYKDFSREILSKLHITEDIFTTIAAAGTLGAALSIPVILYIWLLHDFYVTGKYKNLTTLGKILEKHGETLDGLLIKTFIHCIHSYKSIGINEKDKITNTCMNESYKILKLINDELEQCFDIHTDEECYRIIKEKYKDIFDIDLSSIELAKIKKEATKTKKGGKNNE